jgi:hypothetical protein
MLICGNMVSNHFGGYHEYHIICFLTSSYRRGCPVTPGNPRFMANLGDLAQKLKNISGQKVAPIKIE